MTETEIIESLNRSGYLFESSIVEFLNSKNYFLEPNSVIIDPITKKNRDIDIIAYQNDIQKDYDNKISCQTCFAFELKNNLYPVVLTSKYHFSPTSPDELIREYITTEAEERGYDAYNGFYEYFTFQSGNIYSQYCSFQKKNRNSEIMAFHPEQLYSGISKVVQFCDENKPWWYDRESVGDDADFDYRLQWFRHWLYLPVILLKNDLYELEIVDNNPILNKTECSQLIFNYHHNNEPKSTLVTFVTESGLEKWLDEISKLEAESEKELLKAKRRKGKQKE